MKWQAANITCWKHRIVFMLVIFSITLVDEQWKLIVQYSDGTSLCSYNNTKIEASNLPTEKKMEPCKEVLDWINVANISNIVGNILGLLALGISSDLWGRKRLFIITLILLLVSRFLFLIGWRYCPKYLLAVIFFGGIGETSTNIIFITLYFELAHDKYQTYCILLWSIAYPTSQMTVFLIATSVRHWLYSSLPFTIASTVAFFALYLFNKFHIYKFPESQIWLKTRKSSQRNVECAVLSDKKQPNVDGFKESLLNKINLKNAAILMLAWFTCGVINSEHLVIPFPTRKGNNNFYSICWLGLIRIFSGCFSCYLCRKFGRLWANSFLFMAILSLYGLIYLLGETASWLFYVFNEVNTFLTSAIFCTITLRCLEIFPNSIRVTGCTLAFIFYIVGQHFTFPLLISMGIIEEDAHSIYVLLQLISSIGWCTAAILPETADSDDS